MVRQGYADRRRAHPFGVIAHKVDRGTQRRWSPHLFGFGAQSADVGRAALVDGGHEGRSGLQPAVRREELERDAEVHERRTVTEPGEGEVEPLPHALLAQPGALHTGRLALGDPRWELCGEFTCRCRRHATAHPRPRRLRYVSVT